MPLQRHMGLFAGYSLAAKNWLKQFLIRVLLVTYSVFMIKPVMPVIIDGLAHTFWANVHIATVHVHNGQSHVHYELRKMATDNEKDKSETKYKSAFCEDAHVAGFITAISYTRHQPVTAKPLVCYIRAHTNAEAFIESPPPKPASSLPVTYPSVV